MSLRVRMVLVGALGLTAAAVAFAVQTYLREPTYRGWSTYPPRPGRLTGGHLSMEITSGKVLAVWSVAALVWTAGTAGLVLVRRPARPRSG